METLPESAANDTHKRRNIAGACTQCPLINRVTVQSGISLNNNNGFADKVWAAKSERWLAVNFDVRARELEGLSIVWGYLNKSGKMEKGTNRQDIVNWSGYRYRWINRVNYGIDVAIEKGLLEKYPFNGGFRIKITQKGFVILELWQRRFNTLKAAGI